MAERFEFTQTQGVDVEIRRESIIIYESEPENMKFGTVVDDAVELHKEHIKRLVAFFNSHPEHLE